MRCPSCGFVSFDHLSACKKCGKELPLPPGGRRMAAPVPVAPSAGQPSAVPGGSAEAMDSFFSAPAGDPGSETMLLGGEPSAPAAAPKRAGDTFSFDLPPAAAAPARPAGTMFDPATAARETEVDYSPAGFWIRFVALIVDSIILFAVMLAILVPIGLSAGFMAALSDPAALIGVAASLGAAFSAVSFLVPMLYEVVFIGWRGQTPGKMVLRLKVIRMDGGDVDYVKSFIRWIGKIPSALLLCIGYIMAAFTENKRALHDLIAGTRVVRL